MLIGVLKVILTTFDSNVKLSSFMNHPQQEFSLSGLRRTRLDSSEEMLPAVLCSDNLLLDVLNDRLHSKVTFRFPITTITSYIAAVSPVLCPSQSILHSNAHSIFHSFLLPIFLFLFNRIGSAVCRYTTREPVPYKGGDPGSRILQGGGRLYVAPIDECPN